jgi:hypothetical protein
MGQTRHHGQDHAAKAEHHGDGGGREFIVPPCWCEDDFPGWGTLGLDLDES